MGPVIRGLLYCHINSSKMVSLYRFSQSRSLLLYKTRQRPHIPIHNSHNQSRQNPHQMSIRLNSVPTKKRKYRTPNLFPPLLLPVPEYLNNPSPNNDITDLNRNNSIQLNNPLRIHSSSNPKKP